MMKNLLILSILLLLLLFNISNIGAQNSVDVSYNKHENEQLTQLSDIMGVNNLIVNVKGDLKGKKIILTENRVEKGIISSKVVTANYAPINEDSIVISIMAVNLADNTVKIDIRSQNRLYYQNTYNIPDNANHNLMETKLAQNLENATPIFAYTTGISKKFKINGEIVAGLDYCGLRDAAISPTLWWKEYGISDYIYFTIDIE